MFLVILCMVFFCVFYTSCVKDVARLPVTVPKSFCDSMDVKYTTDIQTIISANCELSGCHDGGSGSTYPNNLGDYATLKLMADQGRIKERVVTLKTMPPSGPLVDSLIQKLNCWLDAGAPNN